MTSIPMNKSTLDDISVLKATHVLQHTSPTSENQEKQRMSEHRAIKNKQKIDISRLRGG